MELSKKFDEKTYKSQIFLAKSEHMKKLERTQKKPEQKTEFNSYEERIHQDLAQFYDHEASKYASTRKKIRLEADIFIDQVKSFPKESLRILELGCGSGRLLEQLSNITDKQIDYTGIDVSA